MYVWVRARVRAQAFICAHVCAKTMSLGNIRNLSDGTCLTGQLGRIGDVTLVWDGGMGVIGEELGGLCCGLWLSCVAQGETGGLICSP